jgi:pimeloyl-[acyl-carrier protein] methyl ester esterase
VRLVFVHGWALEADIWDALGPLLVEFPQIRADLGYFGAPSIPQPQAGDILIGHSAGLLWGLSQNADWAGVVAINSFPRFTFGAEGRGCVRPAALRAMRQALERDPQACANVFRGSLGIAPAKSPAQKERLMEGLDLLRDFDAASRAKRPWLTLGAEDDALAPAVATRDLAQIFGGALALREAGGHGLPWTAPEFCARRIKEFLRVHEF